jgi:formiminotetrahydrofolate cyclodeaminase
VIEASRRAASPAISAAGPPGRVERLAAALSAAADVPMQVVELAAEVTELAAGLAAEGNQALRGDAITAALLAQAGARGAAALVSINLAAMPDDARPGRAQRVLAQIGRSASFATGAI